MAINIRCQKCTADIKLSSKKCRKCGTTVPKNKKYRVVVRINGKRVTKTVNNLELARDIEAKLKADNARGEFDIQKKKNSITLGQAWLKFLSWAKQNKKSWRDDQYLYEKHLKPAFGARKMSSIVPFDIERFLLSKKKEKNRHGRPFKPASLKHMIVLLSRLYSVSEKWGIYSGDNPCKKVKKPKLNNQVTEFLSDKQLNNLLTVLESWPNRMSACFVLFCLYTGLRRGELFKLTWGDIDFTRQTVCLRDPKGGQDQVLPLSNKAIETLKAVPKEFDTPWIFYGKSGQQRTDFKGPWNHIKEAAGLPKSFRLHGLRHHFASSLVSSGVDLYVVQKLLCHKSSTMTQRYAHLADKSLQDAVNLSDQLQTKTDGSNVVNLKNRIGGQQIG